MTDFAADTTLEASSELTAQELRTVAGTADLGAEAAIELARADRDCGPAGISALDLTVVRYVSATVGLASIAGVADESLRTAVTTVDLDAVSDLPMDPSWRNASLEGRAALRTWARDPSYREGSHPPPGRKIQ